MKNVPHFFVLKRNITGDNFLIDDPDAVKHAGKVLRLKLGDDIVLFDGEGGKYEAQISLISKREMVGEILSKTEVKSEKPYVILAQAFPKGAKLDDIVRMNTEVGVREFCFFESEFSEGKRWNFSGKKRERLEKIAQEALRQSEGAILPVFGSIKDFEGMLSVPADHKLLLHSRKVPSSEDINSLEKPLKSGQKVLVAIGPEGGFSDQEVEKARASGFKIVFLNLPILRTETAGVVATGIILS